MSKKLIFIAGILLSLAVLAGCRNDDPGVLAGVIFDRGHGSAWGNQFRVELVADEITLLQYIPEGSGDLETKEHLPLEAQQWNEISEAVQELELTEDRPTLLQKFFEGNKLDGGEYRKLILQWQQGEKVKEVEYLWPEGEQAQKLEKLLEQLTAAVPTQPEKPEAPVEITPEVPVEDVPVGNEDTYWVAETYFSEDEENADGPVAMDPALWSVDLWIGVNGTAYMRDVHNGISLMDDSCRNLTWERTPEGEFLFYSVLYADPILRADYDQGVLTVQYWSTTLYMKQQPAPQTAGQKYLPAELAGTWLMVGGETEGYQWEAMPGKLASLVFRVNADDAGELELVANREELDYYCNLEQSEYNLKTEILNEPLHDGCANEAWCIRVGEASPVDANGDPLQTETYATLLDHNTLLVQEYYTLDGAPAVSHQTYKRFTDLVSWMQPDSMNLDYSNWVCTGFESLFGEDLPQNLENLSVALSPDGKCYVQFADGTTQEGTWAMGTGGAVMLRGDEEAEDPFWFGGVISGYWVETADGPVAHYQMGLCYGGGILKLNLSAYG